MIQSVIKPSQLHASFPILMLCKNRGIIVLFYTATAGIIVGILPSAGEKEYKTPDWCVVGYHTALWETGSFEPWLGTTTLSNQ